MTDYINQIILGNALSILPELPSELVNCVVTSPPYWNLRDYGIEPVMWDGNKNCKHEWGNKTITLKHKSGETNPGKESWFKDRGASNDKGNCFCIKCGAWRGSLGLEPTFELYIKHLCDIFDEVKRVLRKDGTCWINIGDSYWGSDQGGADYGGKEIIPSSNFGHIAKGKNYPNKSLCDIPYRFSIEMTSRGWIKRNTIIWWKPNCMPSSAPDRFTVDFEYLFFFTKNNKTLFWTNEKTLECVDKKPLGTKGIEDKDWEWRDCPKCLGTGFNQKWRVKDKDWAKIKNLHGECEKQGRRIHLGLRNKISEKQKEICTRCKGLRKVKYSFWTGHDYWFEQQFEKYAPSTLPRMDRGVNVNKWTFGADGQTPHNLSQPRLNRKRGYKTKQPDKGTQHPQYHGKDINYGKQGRNKRCVWLISTTQFPEAHFAVYPEKLIEIPIKAGCPEFICKKCGKARIKILEPTEEYKKYLGQGNLEEHHAGQETKTKFKVKTNAEYKIKGYTDCGCNAGFESGIVLDPFIGSGTTAEEALKQRKRFIGIELKQEYIDMANKRLRKIPESLF
jgi:DNA modification methylase